ncbi:MULTISPECIES: 16S rRNA (cytosine(967)-C(5))-methyltransferase RsmB [unclassified Granulicatella]|uniref:16S rRNA (cytosine(967)-C(5))-methyltransferase RsmB n=1 Tax=unclassified Granulicatella TaxID=2630493 RepID=UPI00143200D4|nr:MULTISPECIES: 16S rRNA (cytosine(967)-C(5))-methyltransferase RsmB [unclassified Granulicatella]MBF0780654.1 16S rRNA (cytosine(967)-C(5))-methyltransferase RsmB [Granulicatella sp. 19428wC4_WM01]
METKKLSKSQRKQTPRYLAMKLLVDIEQQSAYSNVLLSKTLEKNQLNTKDANLLTELVYGVTQRRLTLDYVINPFVKKDVPLWVRTILRLSAFQLLYLDRIPAYAVLNEASELTRLKAGQSLVNFVNGVLRNVQRHAKKNLDILHNQPVTIESVSTLVSMPEWLIRLLMSQMTLEDVKTLGLSLLEKPSMSVRSYQRNEDMQTLSETFSCQKSELSPLGIKVSSGNVARTELFKQGNITIQDESSMLVAPSARLQKHFCVLDACAGPGGKTTHIAHYLDAQQGGKVYALDVYEHKLQRIVENAKRLHVHDRVEPVLLDARQVNEHFKQNYFDVAFVDAPCSGLGLMRRKPDIKYAKLENTITALTTIQSDILQSVAPCVKPNGLLMYSTCTIASDENAGTVHRFLEKHPEFYIESLEWLGLPKECYVNGAISLLPHVYHTDGFYICALRKRNE